jgi:class 3 adenylate cyclase
MSFLETVEKARAFLERNGRVSIRALQREYDLNDEDLGELIEELVEIQQVAVRDGRALSLAAGAPSSADPPPHSEAAPEPERSPLDYTPRHLADKILRSKSALEGERKQVTVLFADVKGSMELAEQLDPEEWHRILDRFFQILTDGVHRFEGTVNQYTGDGIMALFGAPIAHEDHAQRACYAALHLKAALREYADELRRRRGLSFSTRIGINSGDVVVGKIGSDLRMDYTAQGQTVGLAQRMEALAEPGCVYLTNETRRLAEGYFALRPLGDFEVRGSRDAIAVYELTGLGTQRTRLDRSRARGFSRFIGRRAELENLESALDQAVSGRGRVVGVVAEAGTGKSRLCDEFIEHCRGRDIRVLAAHCPAHGQSVAFLPVLELLRESFGIEDTDTDLEARRKIAGELTLLDPEFQGMLPLLFEFLGVPDPDRPSSETDPAERERQLLGFVRHLAQARSAREPSVVFIDDLHWVDPGSEAFVAQLVEVAATTRTLVLCNFRPEYRAYWMQQSHYQQIPLNPLGTEEVRQLVADLLGSDESIADLGAHIYDRTGGNPFFVEEIVQSLVESGQLEGERGAYRLTSRIADLTIPPTVHAVLAARIDRLAERDKRVLQIASVIGREVPESLLIDVAELSKPELTTALSGLQRGEFLLQHVLYPEAEYLFKHALTLDVAYSSQLTEPRARLHANVARAAEARAGDRLDELSGLLAHHWEAAGDAACAARWHVRSARWVGLTQSTEMLRHLNKAIDLLGNIQPTADTRALEAEALSQILLMVNRVGVLDDKGELAARANQLLEQSGDPLVRARLLYGIASWELFQGDLEAAAAHFPEAISSADTSGVAELRIAARYTYALSEMFRGALTVSVAELEAARDIWAEHSELRANLVGYDAEPATLGFLGLLKALQGFGDESTVLWEQGLELARGRDAPSRAIAHSWAALAAATVGQRERSLALGLRSFEISEPVNARNVRGLAMIGLGWGHLASEQWSDAARLLQRVWDETTGLQQTFAYCGRAVLESEGPEAGLAAAERHVALTEKIGTHLFEATARLDLADVLVRLPELPRERVEQELARASELIDEMGAPALRPRIHEVRALLDPSQREHELQEAQRLYAEMGFEHKERIAAALGE